MMRAFLAAWVFVLLATGQTSAEDFRQLFNDPFFNDARERWRQERARSFREQLKLAEKGSVDAQLFVGQGYMNGVGTVQDCDKAVHWFQKALGRGGAVAKHGLGWAFFNGCGVPKIHARAKSLMKEAALSGNATIQFDAAIVFYQSKRDPGDILKAYEWIERALAGFEKQYNISDLKNTRMLIRMDRLRRQIASDMSPEQIADAVRMLRQPLPKPGVKSHSKN